MSEAMSEEATWSFPGEWAWAGSWGPKRVAVEKMLRPLMEQFSSYSCRAESVLAAGDRVVVEARAIATTIRGDAYPQTYCYIFQLREGKIVEVVEYCNTALVERVLEPPPEGPPQRPSPTEG